MSANETRRDIRNNQKAVAKLEEDSRDLGWRGGGGSKKLKPMIAAIATSDDSELGYSGVGATDVFDSASPPFWTRTKEYRLFLAFGVSGGMSTAVNFSGADLFFAYERATYIEYSGVVDIPFMQGLYVPWPWFVIIYPITAAWSVPSYTPLSGNMPRIAWASQPTSFYQTNNNGFVNPVTNKIDNYYGCIVGRRLNLFHGRIETISGTPDQANIEIAADERDDAWRNAYSATNRNTIGSASHYSSAGFPWRLDTSIFSQCIHAPIQALGASKGATIYGLACYILTPYDYAQFSPAGTDLDSPPLPYNVPTIYTPSGTPPSLPPQVISASYIASGGIQDEEIGEFTSAPLPIACESPFDIDRASVSNLVDATTGHDQVPMHVYCSVGWHEDEAVSPLPEGAGAYNNFFAQLDL